MKRIILILITICLIIPLSSFYLPIKKEQGIKGRITWLEGNQMPKISDAPIQTGVLKGEPVVRTVQIFPLVNLADAKMENGLFQSIAAKPIAETTSNEKGEFKIKLPPGQYSVFTVEEDGLFANIFDQNGDIQPINIKKKKWSKLDIVINYKAFF